MVVASRRSRQEWLVHALEIVAREGEAELRIDRLVEAMGVTKGSFYWHFESRADFVRSLSAHWAEWSTSTVVRALEELPPDPLLRLRALMDQVIREGLTRYELAMRAWAAHDPEVAQVVRAVDRTRIRTVKGLFQDLGFEGEDLESRTRLFITYLSMEGGILERESKRKRLAQLDRRLEILTRP